MNEDRNDLVDKHGLSNDLDNGAINEEMKSGEVLESEEILETKNNKRVMIIIDNSCDVTTSENNCNNEERGNVEDERSNHGKAEHGINNKENGVEDCNNEIKGDDAKNDKEEHIYNAADRETIEVRNNEMDKENVNENASINVENQDSGEEKVSRRMPSNVFFTKSSALEESEANKLTLKEQRDILMQDIEILTGEVSELNAKYTKAIEKFKKYPEEKLDSLKSNYNDISTELSRYRRQYAEIRELSLIYEVTNFKEDLKKENERLTKNKKLLRSKKYSLDDFLNRPDKLDFDKKRETIKELTNKYIELKNIEQSLMQEAQQLLFKETVSTMDKNKNVINPLKARLVTLQKVKTQKKVELNKKKRLFGNEINRLVTAANNEKERKQSQFLRQDWKKRLNIKEDTYTSVCEIHGIKEPKSAPSINQAPRPHKKKNKDFKQLPSINVLDDLLVAPISNDSGDIIKTQNRPGDESEIAVDADSKGAFVGNNNQENQSYRQNTVNGLDA